jgi:hypothetical protein
MEVEGVEGLGILAFLSMAGRIFLSIGERMVRIFILKLMGGIEVF